jgi:hypothetical protein
MNREIQTKKYNCIAVTQALLNLVLSEFTSEHRSSGCREEGVL